MRRIFCAVLLLCVWAGTAQAQLICRQAIALGLDVSGSVDEREYRQQLDGLAAALNAPEVRAALLAAPEWPIMIYVFEWSGLDHQRSLIDWTGLQSEIILNGVIATLRGTERRKASLTTALGEAMAHGTFALRNGPACRTLTLDISGDGKNNVGPKPKDVKTRDSFGQVTINALVIGADDPDMGDLRQVEIGELSAYFSDVVIHGPDAFVQVALGFSDYERAMTEKLLREIEGLSLSRLDNPDVTLPRDQ